MSNALFELGRQGFLSALIDFSGATIKSKLLDLATADTWNKIITSVTGAASPITVTSNSHGFSNGDILVVTGVGGNLAANQLCKAANVAANTFDIQTLEGNAMTGNAAYTSGGEVINLTQAQFLASVDASSVGTDVTLAGKSVTNGVANASAWTHTAVPTQANPIRAFILYKDTGAAATSNLISFHDGKTQLYVDAQAAASATTIVIKPAIAAIPNGTVITFSDGSQATLTAAVVVGDRTLTVSALAAIVHAGATADVVTTSAGLPVTPNGGDIQITPDTGVNHLFKL